MNNAFLTFDFDPSPLGREGDRRLPEGPLLAQISLVDLVERFGAAGDATPSEISETHREALEAAARRRLHKIDHLPDEPIMITPRDFVS